MEALHKRGDTRSDGRRFWAYEKQPNGTIIERWRPSENYDRLVIATRRLSAAWKRRQRAMDSALTTNGK